MNGWTDGTVFTSQKGEVATTEVLRVEDIITQRPPEGARSLNLNGAYARWLSPAGGLANGAYSSILDSCVLFLQFPGRPSLDFSLSKRKGKRYTFKIGCICLSERQSDKEMGNGC